MTSSVSSSPSSAPKPSASLAAALIVRDEARCIVRCLESVRPWVDRMVVVDTGSTDDTAALAARCGAEVHHLEWPDDFSAARNHALDLADSDWNLIIDADEWIASGGEKLRPWCEGPPRLGKLYVESAFDSSEAEAAGAPPPSSRIWQTRLLPSGVRYEGRVHEQAVSGLPRERIAAHIGHDGYFDAQLDRKRDRNRPLLMMELQDRPDDPYILFQLGTEAEGRCDFAAASDFYAKAFARMSPDANWLHDLFVRYLHCLGKAGRVDEALSIADEHMQTWLESPDFFFVLGNLALERALVDPAKAVAHWLPFAATAWERCLAIGERPDLEGSVAGRGSHLARHNLEVIQAQLALFAA